MIASVVATIKPGRYLDDVMADFSGRTEIEFGKVSTSPRRVPVTIDAPSIDVLEDLTRELQDCEGVEFVDVVFVHFEQEAISSER